MRIKDEIRLLGSFWLPETPEDKISGILTVSDGGDISLELIGLLTKKSSLVSSGSDVIKRIVGETTKYGYVTLEQCIEIQRQYSTSQPISKITANTLYGGVRYDADEEAAFNSFSFSVDGLDEWLGISGFEYTYSNAHNVNIDFKLPNDISFELAEELTLEFLFTYQSGHQLTQKEALLSQKAYIRIKSTNELPLERFQKLANRITHLLRLAIGLEASISEVEVTSKEFEGKVDVFYMSTPFSPEEPQVVSHFMLFNLNDMKSDTFKLWLTHFDKYSPTFNSYFAIQPSSKRLLEERYITLIGGLESYSRRSNNKKLMDQNQYDQLIDGIIDKCPLEHQEWLEGRLKFGNEIALRERVMGLIEPFQGYFGSKKARKNLVSKIVDTRNYLTHFNEDLEKQSAKGTRLLSLIFVLEALYQLHFLSLLGFSKEKIAAIVKTKPSIRDRIEHAKSSTSSGS
ncbi:HEPN domain-containing protein [Luteithermobacter gelatinilyticus]|uniref:ApeA N-terminal domain 1-containing protein n=1 Tax=Luteithermobacter gelatinilyticus TaxID=2582913 RepID=UPI001106B54E|nr:HEPN domain-containing protein [Luteithermobacter gelatinilyticus]